MPDVQTRMKAQQMKGSLDVYKRQRDYFKRGISAVFTVADPAAHIFKGEKDTHGHHKIPVLEIGTDNGGRIWRDSAPAVLFLFIYSHRHGDHAAFLLSGNGDSVQCDISERKDKACKAHMRDNVHGRYIPVL